MTHRCPACGRRVVATRGCPVHGPVSVPPAAPPDPATGVEEEEAPVIPGYRLSGVLGRGGFGAVYRALRLVDGAPAAIKVARRDRLETGIRLGRESEVLRALGPPHTPAWYDSGKTDDGFHYLIMEILEPPSLADWLTAEPGFPAPAAASVGAAVLEALAWVHARGFVHRDLKPDNVFLSLGPGGTARLIDFGLAIPAGGEADPELTKATGAVGTPEYMSPEQADASPSIDARSDIYAVAVLLYEMLAGRPPFTGQPGDVREAHRSLRPPPPSQFASVPRALEEVVLRSLSKDPSLRHPDVGALLREWNLAGTLRQDSVQRPAQQTSGAPASQSHTAVLLFFESTATALEMEPLLGSLGGCLAHVSRARRVAVFDHGAGDNPGERAVKAAQRLIGSGKSQRISVDLGQVVARARRDRSPLYVSGAFSDETRYPPASAPPGVHVAEAVAKLLGPAAADAPAVTTIETSTGLSLPTVVQSSAAPLVGRAGALSELLDSARAAVAGSMPTIATVLAEPGHGKTHLCAALVSDLRAVFRGREIVVYRAPDPMGGEPAPSLVGILARLWRVPEKDLARVARAHVVEILGADAEKENWPPLAVAAGWLPASAPEVRQWAIAPGALRSAGAHAAGELIRHAAARAPLALVLDDAQFADDATLDALEYASIAEAKVPLWLGICARPTLEVRRPGWGHRAAVHRRIVLGPLDEGSAGELCRALLAPARDVPATVIDRLVSKAQRIPILLTELVRGLKDQGFVRRSNAGGWFVATDELDRLPDLPLLQWRTSRELEALPAALAAHARFVAALGREFRLAEAIGVMAELERQGVAGDFPLDPAAGTRQLISHGLLVTHRSGQIGFRHALVREAIYAATPASLQKAVHDGARLYYRAAGALSEEYRLSRLALHAAAAGAREEALPAYLRLAERAESRHQYLDAELFFGLALEQLASPDDPRAVGAFKGQALMRYRLGRYDDALLGLRRARALVHASGDRVTEVDLLLDEATILDWRSEYSESLARLEDAERRWPAQDTALLRARAALARARSSYRLDGPRVALPLFRQATALAEQAGEEGYETLVIGLLLCAPLVVSEGQVDEAESLYGRLVTLCEAHHDLLHLAAALNNRRELWAGRCNLERAVEDASRSRAIGRELGQPALEYVTAYNIAELCYYAGDMATAEQEALRAAELEPLNSPRPLAQVLRARVALAAGGVEKARTIVEAIRGAQASARARNETAALLLEPEAVLCDMVDLATRDVDAAAWDALLARSSSSSTPWEHAEVTEMRGLVALTAGRATEGRQYLGRALEAAARPPHLIQRRIQRELTGC